MLSIHSPAVTSMLILQLLQSIPQLPKPSRRKRMRRWQKRMRRMRTRSPWEDSAIGMIGKTVTCLVTIVDNISSDVVSSLWYKTYGGVLCLSPVNTSFGWKINSCLFLVHRWTTYSFRHITCPRLICTVALSKAGGPVYMLYPVQDPDIRWVTTLTWYKVLSYSGLLRFTAFMFPV